MIKTHFIGELHHHTREENSKEKSVKRQLKGRRENKPHPNIKAQ